MIATALVMVVIVLARFAWLYPATYLPRMFSKSLRERDPSPPWQWPFALAFTGVRGSVSRPPRWRCRSRCPIAMPSRIAT